MESKKLADLKENCLYFIKNGKLHEMKAPDSGFGECTGVWKDGKLLDVVKSERMRI